MNNKILKITKQKIEKLLNDFKENNAVESSEENIQANYLLDLLKILGWEKNNIFINEGQEVKTGKRPDILLKDDEGNTIQVIETKDASKSDKLNGTNQDTTYAEQLYSYCEAEGIYWGILTNFIEWRVFNTHLKRLYNDTKYAFHSILWDKVDKKNYINILSPQGIEFLSKLTKKNLIKEQGRWDLNSVYYPEQEEIKNDFFIKLKNWREQLRTYILKKYSKHYNSTQIELIVQKIIDKLIFIDYCSDNQIIGQDKLHAILHSKKNIYDELKNIVFKEMDERFNSEIFAIDECTKLDLDDAIIIPIIRELASINFSKLSVNIIGEVYENYLGELLKKSKKSISLDEEEGKKKKKKQGIYYTPESIVQYIIENTIRPKLSKIKTEEDLKKIKVLDPACGSGSFLIKVFEELLFHYRRIAGGTLLFDFDLRKKILQNNIYGVDLDERAVEISKLNLVIKTLEGIKYQNIKGKKLLPNMKLNIRCGNSLISEEVIKETTLLSSNSNSKELINDILELKKHFHKTTDDEVKEKLYKKILVLEEQLKINSRNLLKENFKDIEKIRPFNFEISFCEALSDNGFDFIIGNPPYINVENLEDEELAFYMKFYETSLKRFDIYIAFIEKSILLLKEGGLLGFIIPYPFLTQDYGQKLRKYILDNCKIINIYNLFKTNVFEGVAVKNIVLIIEKCSDQAQRNGNIISVYDGNKTDKIKQKEFYEIPENMYRIDAFSKKTIGIINKIKENSINLGKVAIASWGARGVPVEQFHLDNKINDFCKKMIKGKNISRYKLDWADKWLLYDKTKLYRPAFEELFESEKIFISKVTGVEGIKAVYDNKKYYSDDSLSCVILKYNIENKDKSFLGKRKINIEKNDIELSREYSLKFLLGLINSKLINFYFNNFLGYNLNVYPESIEQIPIIKLNNTNKDLVVEIISLVEKILSLNESKSNRENEIQAVDKEIDRKIYELYEISDKEEIKIVEESLE